MGSWEEEKATLQSGGVSDQEINDEEQRQRDQLFKGGVPQKEIDDHFGVKQFDPTPVQQHVKQNLEDYAQQNGEKGPDGQVVPKPASSFVEALEAGWQMSVSGLLKNGKMPDTVLPEDAGMFYRIASGVGSIAGDIPAMIAGGIGGGAIGGAAGSEAPIVGNITGAALGSGAGAFAVPAGMRRILMDHYAKGDVKDAGDFFERASSAFIEAAKGAATGAATTLTGGAFFPGSEKIAAGAVASAFKSLGAGAATTALAKTASEIATMTTVSKALEGQAPHPQDFLDAAILVGGMHLATGISAQLREAYARTGRLPSEVAFEAEKNPVLQQELVSTNPDPAKIAELATGLPQPPRTGDVVQPETERPPYEYKPMNVDESTEGKTFYHGTKSALNNLSDAGPLSNNKVQSLYGEGLYLTDNPDVATSYAVGKGKGRPGQVLAANLKDLKLMDLEQPPPSNARQILLAEIQKLDGDPKELGLKPESSGKDYYNALKEAMADKEYTHSDAVEQFQELNQKLTEAGFDGLRHEGGLATSSKLGPHNVAILFDDVYKGLPEGVKSKLQDLPNDPSLQPKARTYTPLENWQNDVDNLKNKISGLDAYGDHEQIESLKGDLRNLMNQKPAEPPAAGEPPSNGRSDAENTILSQIGEKGEKEKAGYSFSKFYTDFVDRLNPVRQAMIGMMGKENYDKFATSPLNPLNLMRGVSDAPAKTRHFLEQGTVDFNTLGINGKGFNEIVDPFLKDPNGPNGLIAYLLSKRAIEVEGKGISSGFDLDAAKQVVKDGSGKYEQASQDLTDYQNRTLKYLADSGRISRDLYETLVEANKSYVPLSRIVDTGEEGGGGKSPLSNLKKLTGVGLDVKTQNPLQSIVENTTSMIRLAEKNRAMTALIDQVEAHPEQTLFEKTDAQTTVFKADEAEMQKWMDKNGIEGDAAEFAGFRKQTKTTLGPDEFEVYRDGKREVWSTDKDTATAIKSLDGDVSSQNLFLTLARGMTGALKIGTTLTPDFIARHLFRNQLISGTYSEIGRVPFTGILSAIGDIWNKNDTYYNWLKSGGAGGAFLPIDQRYINENIGKLEQSTGFMQSAHNVLDNGVKKMEFLGTLFEQSTRLAEFKRMVGDQTEGPDIFKGGNASRDITIDYQRMGAKMSAWNAITAFQNVSIQSGDRLVRAFQDDPTGTMTKGLAYITAPTLALWWATKDDERIKEIPQWEKDMFWLFPTDNWQKAAKPEDANGLPSYLVRQGKDGGMEINKGTVFRLPIPQELGVLFKVLPERILNAFAGSNPETLKSLTETVGGLVTPAFLPDIAKAPMEQFTNKSFFTGSSIVPYGAEKLLPQYQYTDYTSETAKALGKIISYIPGVRDIGPAEAKLASPQVVENYVQAWGGTLGKYALQIADKALTTAGVAKDLKPESTLADIPFVKAFVVRYPTSNSQSLQDFRDLYTQHAKVMATIQMLGKQGDVSEMQNVYSRYQDQAYQIQGTHEAISNLNHEIQMVYQNPEMSKSDKRVLIDQMYYGMTEAAHQGVKLFNDLDTALKNTK